MPGTELSTWCIISSNSHLYQGNRNLCSHFIDREIEVQKLNRLTKVIQDLNLGMSDSEGMKKCLAFVFLIHIPTLVPPDY